MALHVIVVRLSSTVMTNAFCSLIPIPFVVMLRKLSALQS